MCLVFTSKRGKHQSQQIKNQTSRYKVFTDLTTMRNVDMERQ